MFRVVTFCGSSASWRRSNSETAWQPQEAPGRSGRGSSSRGSDQACMRRSRGQQLDGAAGAAGAERVRGAAVCCLSSVVCCPVYGKPVRRRAMQPADGVQRTAAAGPDWQGNGDIGAARRAAGGAWWTGSMVCGPGAGGRSSRPGLLAWCRQPAMDGYDAG